MQSWQYVSLIIFAVIFVVLFFAARKRYDRSRLPAGTMRYIFWVARFSIMATIVLALMLRATHVI